MIREIISNDILILNKLVKNIDENEVVDNNIFNHPFSKYLVYLVNNEIVAFLKYSRIYEVIEIDYVYTIVKYRNNGYSTSLINYVINKFDNFPISLEVRISNKSAIELYKKCGFTQKVVRKNYYGNEDAVFFVKE